MRGRWSSSSTGGILSPQVLLHNNLSFHIEQVLVASSHLDSIEFKFALDGFKNFIAGQYRIEASTNNEQYFITELFSCLTLKSLKENPLHFVIFRAALIDVNFSTKLIKVNRISREIADIPPSANPIVFQFFDRIIKWLVNPLATSLHLIIQPLRDKIIRWSSSGVEEQEIASLHLLDVFLRRFPSHMNPIFENAKITILKSLQHTSPQVSRAAARVLRSSLVLLDTPFASFAISLCQTVSALMCDIINAVSPSYIDAVFWIAEKEPRALPLISFKRPPLHVFSCGTSFQLLRLFRLAYLCNPDSFTGDNLKTVFEKFYTLLTQTASPAHQRDILQSLGGFCFCCCAVIQAQFQREVQPLRAWIEKNWNSDEACFAYLSLLSPKDAEFRQIIDSVFGRPLSSLVVSGICQYCTRWPQKAPVVRPRVLPYFGSVVFEQGADDVLLNAFTHLARFRFAEVELSLNLLLQYARYLNSESRAVRWKAAQFLLSQQGNFPDLKIRLIAFVTSEVNEELRVKVLRNLTVDDSAISEGLIGPLYTLLHDLQPQVRHAALTLLVSLQAAQNVVMDFIAEIVGSMERNESIERSSIFAILITIQHRPDWVKHFTQFLIPRLIRSSWQRSYSLALLSHLLEFDGSLVSDVSSLATIIVTNLSRHVSKKRISAALDLLRAALKYTQLNHELRTKHTLIIARLCELACDEVSEEWSLKLLEILEHIGTIHTDTMKGLTHHKREDVSSSSLNSAFVRINSKSSVSSPLMWLTNLAVFRSLFVIFDIVNEESLSHLHSVSIESLLAILSGSKNIGDEVLDMVLEKIDYVVTNGGSRTVTLVIPLLSCLGDRMAPILPHVIDMICGNWDKLDSSLILKTVQWIAVQVPQIFVPYMHRIVALFMNSIETLPPEKVEEIFVAFISFGSLLKYIDYLLIPAICSWMELHTHLTDVACHVLICLKAIVGECGSSKYCESIVRTLLLICRRNPDLVSASIDVLLVLAVQMQKSFVVYMVEISQVFKSDELKELQKLLQWIAFGFPPPAKLVKKYDLENRQIKPDPIGSPQRVHDTGERYRPTAMPRFDIPGADWDEFQWENWFDEVVSVFLSMSPSKAVSACASLAKYNTGVRNTLFPVTYALFIASDPDCKDRLLHVLQVVFAATAVRPNIVRAFLSVVELLEINKLSIPVSWAILAERAMQSGQLAQALRYNEAQFQAAKQEIAKNLISLNLKLGLRLAANGILACSHVKSEMFQQSLGMWENALDYYNDRLSQDPENEDAQNGKMECLDKLHRYRDLAEFTRNAPGSFYSASAALRLGDYTTFRRVVPTLDPSDVRLVPYRVIWHVLEDRLDEAELLIRQWNTAHINRIFPMNPEDFDLHEAALFAELSDVIEFKRTETLRYSAAPFARRAGLARMHHIIDGWKLRFAQMGASTLLMFDAIIIRSLVVSNAELEPFWLAFIDHAMAAGRSQLLDIALSQVDASLPEVRFAECVLSRFSGDDDARPRLAALIESWAPGSPLLCRALTQLSDWAVADGDPVAGLAPLRRAIDIAPNATENWERWAKLTFEISTDVEGLRLALEACLSGMKIASSLSFALRILSILGKRSDPSLLSVFVSGYRALEPRAWIALLPQITAMLRNPALNVVLEQLLLFVAGANPHVVVYALMPQFMSGGPTDATDALRTSQPSLVGTALEFSREMVRIASSWWEDWSNAIDEASRRYVVQGDLAATTDLLLPLHAITSRAPETLFEVAFAAQFDATLAAAEQALRAYVASGELAHFHGAWTRYVDCYKKMRAVIKDFASVYLRDASPTLFGLCNSELTVPGLHNELVRIQAISPRVAIMRSKQLPRKVSIVGADGVSYGFLLKAHEDTRLDERIMQLFDFVSDVVGRSTVPLANRLTIISYKVLPFTEKVGLIGWVPNAQTLFEVVSQYRAANNTPADIEMARSYSLLPKYDTAPLQFRIKAFRSGLRMTSGDDLQKVLLKYSTDCNDWLQRRLTYATSLAITSIAGYILGLGDRHMCNIMMNNRTAKLVHIDFSDCFDVATNREMFPEKVPFRLTRVMVNALEVSGVEGTLRSCMENVMQLLRDKRSEIMALLEAWLCDPVEQMLALSQENALDMIGQRVRDKLSGTEFGGQFKSVQDQIDTLIRTATDVANLAQMYKGWFPWW
jgi:FKBP12-rapamycin complex-associated protein